MHDGRDAVTAAAAAEARVRSSCPAPPRAATAPSKRADGGRSSLDEDEDVVARRPLLGWRRCAKRRGAAAVSSPILALGLGPSLSGGGSVRLPRPGCRRAAQHGERLAHGKLGSNGRR